MIWQFDHRYEKPRYWVDEVQGRSALGGDLGYRSFRVGFRDIAASTNERTMVSAVIPPAFHGNKLPTVSGLPAGPMLALCALWNSFLIDWCLRQRVTTTLNFFYIYQLPIPRLNERDPASAQSWSALHD